MKSLILNPKFIIVAIVVLLALIAVFAIYNYRTSPDFMIEHYDEETGDVWYEYPNRDPEFFGEARPMLLGDLALRDTPLTTAQYAYTEEELFAFVEREYADRYDLIKILPNTIDFKPGQLVFHVRLGNSDSLLKVGLVLPSVYEIQVKISEQSSDKLYESPLTDLRFSSAESTPQQPEYTGDGVPPEAQ